MALIQSLSTRGKITLAGCALAFLAAAVMIIKMAGAPSYTTVMSGVDPAKTGQITAALTAAGVPFELQNGGTAIAVQKGKETAANVALASKGLNTSSQQPGLEIMDKQKLGASSQQQQIAYQRGLEGTIANTISQIEGGQGAQVNLTLAQDNLFADQSRGATAAVLLPGGSEMDPSSVKGIANLVASSVPGLKPSAVTITDGTGTMLWPNGDGSGADASGLPSKTAAEQRYDTATAAALNAAIANVVGPGKALVQVNADLNVDQTSQDSLTYAKKGVPVEQKQTSESLKGSGAGAGGTAGTAGNLPNYPAGVTGGGGNNNYKNASKDTSFLYDKTVTHTVKAPGSVNKLQVGVLVDSTAKLTPANLTAIKQVISASAGLQPARGDTIAISQIPFAAQPAAAKPAGLPIPPAFAGILKVLGIGIGVLFFLFFVTRHLRKREREALADEPSWLKQLEASRPSLELPRFEDISQDTAIMRPPVATSDPRRQHLDSVIQEEPERVAAHLRQWITEDSR